MRLRTIEPKGIRGIPSDWPTLEIGERGFVLYGPNGTGKTSIVDAIEYLLTQRSTLFAENRLGVNWNAARFHIASATSDARLTIADGARTWSIEYDAPPPPGAVAWCDSARKSSFLLRRYMLLRFVDAQPKGRYERLEPFLNLDEFVSFEEALTALKLKVDTKRTQLSAQLAVLEGTLRAIFGLGSSDTISDDTILAMLNTKLLAVGIASCPGLDSLGEATAGVDSLAQSNIPSERYVSLMRLRKSVQQIVSAEIYDELIDRCFSAFTELETELAAHKGLVITELLEAANRAISENELSECPICERPIDAGELSSRLQARIDADIRFTTLRQNARSRTIALLHDLESGLVAWRNLISEWERNIAEPLPQNYHDEQLLFTEFVEVLKANPKAEAVKNFMSRVSACSADRNDLLEIIDKLAASEANGSERLALTDVRGMLTALTTQWPLYVQKGRSLVRLDSIFATVDRAHRHAVASRKEVVQELLDQIASIANEMYEYLHPGEKIANSMLVVRPKEDGSVNLQTNFHGKVGSPRLHFSESHLDTLGLCYFLALRKYEAQLDNSFRLLVLDDVLHSVDAEHRGRVAQLLKRNFSDHQIVLTTHDEFFFAV